MSTYKEFVHIPKQKFDWVNRMLAIYYLEELTDEELRKIGANTNYCEGIYGVKFEDGSTLNYDLCSGTSNYYDDVVWTSPNGCRDVVLDCDYSLDDIEFDVDGNTYMVSIVQDEDETNESKYEQFVEHFWGDSCR